MEEKRRDAGTLSSSSSLAGEDSPASEPPSSRRRAGGNKRKANNLSSPGASIAPSKRVTRDKGFNFHPPIHNGPLTRARQGPGSLSAAGIVGATASPVTSVKPEEATRALDGTAAEEFSRASREWEALEASIEAEVEAVRSRDANSHVVPCHCGWFSWSKPHPIEELTLPSFFDGKSKTRTSDMYMEIRNWIMKKFHADPNTPIKLKDLSELEVGDLDARQEIMEFLECWGLINFHPALPKDSSPANVDSHKEEEKDTSLENLYHFEVQQLRPPVLLKTNTTTPAMATGFFPESTIAEELAGPEGPSVEYHCNSCSADCSRKRYHCQKQADFDLCSNCFSDGKFDSNMSSSDFILMEPAELPGVNGGNWTDQETLLLLEALELYKENWNEIAEHVATKTKAQCILHFVQMPIEDCFLDYDEDRDANSKEPTDTSITKTDSCTPKDIPETTELKTGDAEGQSQTSPMETSKPEDSNEVKTEQEALKPDEGSEAKSCPEILKHEDTKDMKIVEDMGENYALKALRDAFEAIGYPTPEGLLSFADVANPVMALAAYLARLVEPDIATASAHGSLKSVHGNSSGMQLAVRHCFLLEGPPDHKKEPGDCGSDATGMVGKDAQNNNDEDLVQEKKEPSSNDESNAAKEADATGKHEDGSCNLLESNKSETVKDQLPSSLKKSDDIASKVKLLSSSAMDSEDHTPAGNCSHSTEAPKDVDMVSSSFSSDKNVAPPQSVSTNIWPTTVSKADVDMTSETLSSKKNELQQNVASEPIEPSKSTEGPEDLDMVSSSSLPSAKTDIQQSVTTNSIVENRTSEEKEEKIENKEDNKEKNKDKKEKSDSMQKKDDQDIDKLKRAAVSALSAAAVKAKFLANQEEEQVKELAASLIEKQLHKLETKLGFFSEMDNVMVRVREQMDRSRQRLFQERAQIIAARLGLPASSSRAMPPSLPMNRIATNFANSVPRPPMMTMTAQKPPFSRPIGAIGPAPSNPLVSASVAGGSTQPSGQDNVVLK